MDERLQKIRKRLRLAMNGTISASMREKGNVYKLNFGVPIPELRLIAKEYEPNAELAEMMWQEDTRELKILATLLYPHDSMDEPTVTRWITEIPYPEISEQMAFNLLRYLPNEEAILGWCLTHPTKGTYIRQTGLIMLGHRCRKAGMITIEWLEPWLALAKTTFDSGTIYERQAALFALRSAGQGRPEVANHILESLSAYKDSCELPLREIYDALKFEFDYSME